MRGALDVGWGEDLEKHKNIMGAGETDPERVFPRRSTAHAAAKSEVTVNGKNVKVWEYAQLEALKPAVLRQRAMVLRDALGEDRCPPMPSQQAGDLTKWILHVQSDITKKDVEVGPVRGGGVPPSYMKERQDRPIQMQRAPSPRQAPVPFGPRKGHQEMGVVASRDHYNDLLEQRNEFKEAVPRGIGTMRVGGEGRRHIFPKTSMDTHGISAVDDVGIEAMKQKEGRRYIRARDSVAEQKREAEAIERGEAPAVAPRRTAESTRLGGDAMRKTLFPDADETSSRAGSAGYPSRQAAPIGGERKRHIIRQDHMLTPGVSSVETGHVPTFERRHVPAFGGW